MAPVMVPRSAGSATIQPTAEKVASINTMEIPNSTMFQSIANQGRRSGV
jgi:hypothetical protein